VVDRSARFLGRLTGHRHDLDDLLGGEGGRLPRPGGVGEDLFQKPSQRPPVVVLLGSLQGGRGLLPAVSPVADGHARQAQLPGDGVDAGIGLQGQEDGGASDQALVGGLLSLNLLQHGALGRGDLDRGRLWSSHRPTPSTTPSTIPESLIRIRGTPPSFWIADTAARY
jgi:hypothetical protein